MKRIFCLLVFCLAGVCLVAGQTVSEIKADRATYLWGEGKGNTLKKADGEALADLINQISTTVESRFELLQQEKGTDFEETFRSVINTYSTATLSNTERIVIGNEPDAHVFRYMKRSEIGRIFESRKKKILEYAASAQRAEEHLQLADALRYYYWAQTLLRSLPDASEVHFRDERGEEHLLSAWLPLQINTLFAGVDVSVVRLTKDGTWQEAELAVSYRGKPVRNFDYTYWDGRDWSNIVSAKDGRGVAELPELADASEIRLRGEYVCEGEATVDAELRDVLSKLDVVPYRSCYLTAKAAGSGKDSAPEAGLEKVGMLHAESGAVVEAVAAFFVPAADSVRYLSVIERVETAIRTQQYEAVRDCFDAGGYDMFTRLIHYGRARVYGTPDYRVVRAGNAVICRSLPLSFSFRNNSRTFVEDVVFEFGKDAKIVSLSFALSQAALQDIVAKERWGESSRMTLIRFLENYKTAYALKRVDYIESIFADDALIITGSVLKKQATNDRQQVVLDKQAVRYTRQTKEQYIRRLRSVFASNEFINLRFADNSIRKSGTQGELYGIQIRQDYFSTNYGDTGYLFLMVDLNKPAEPIIHVRAWQPEKDPDFGLIDLSHFTF